MSTLPLACEPSTSTSASTAVLFDWPTVAFRSEQLDTSTETVTMLLNEGVHLRNIIGRGTYGRVIRGWHVDASGDGGQWVAVKILDLRRCTEQYINEHINREIDIVRRLQIYNNGSLSDAEAKPIFRQLFEALHYLHDRQHVLHRDLKCENVLLDRWDNVKLCDFGFSCLMQKGVLCSDFWGTRTYAENLLGIFPAPEIINCIPYQGFGIDIWSAGVVLFVSLTGQNRTRLAEMEDHEPIIRSHPDLSTSNKQMLLSLLNRNPNDRPKYAQIIHMQWMADTPYQFRLPPLTYRLHPASAARTATSFSQAPIQQPEIDKNLSVAQLTKSSISDQAIETSEFIDNKTLLMENGTRTKRHVKKCVIS